MPELTLERLRADGEAFQEALGAELWRAGAGHQREAHLQPIHARFAHLSGDEAFALVREAFDEAADGSDARRRARVLLEWVADSRAARAVAEIDERQIAWESSAVVDAGDGRRVPYQRVSIALATTRDREARRTLDDARATLAARELAPLAWERLQRDRDETLGLGLAGTPVASHAALSGIDLAELGAQCVRFLDDTRAMWDEVLPVFLKRELALAPREATRADALALFRATRFDGAFPADAMEPRILGQAREMGIDPEGSGRIRIDTAEREGKRARAFCAPVRVPDEVHLVLRPHGGAADWRTFLHELGHALHFGYASAALPFEDRWLGDNSVTEGYAMLLDHRVHDRRWLLRYTALTAGDVREWLEAAAVEELHFLRRYCAKLLFELRLHDSTDGMEANARVYEELLTDATTFRYRASDAFLDVDPRFYSARYLRAWQLQATLAESLTARFDEDWWRNPRTGPWMTEQLFGVGQREAAPELAARVGSGEGLTFAPLIRAIERALG